MQSENLTYLLTKILLAKDNEEFSRRLIKAKMGDLMELALRNKVLLHLAERLKALNLDALVPEACKKRVEKQLRKLELDLQFINQASELANLHGIDLVVVKTIKPFTYVGDDVDLLVRRSHYRQLVKLIVHKLGFKVEGWGPAETTLYRYVDGIKLMVDIHYKLATSTLSYVDTDLILKAKHRAKITTPISHEVIEAPIPSSEYTILITATHALLKELRINLADILTLYYLRGKVNQQLLHELAVYEGLTKTINLVNEIAYKVLTLKQGFSLPYKPRVSTILECYIEKIMRALSKGRYFEVLKIPLTNIKGYGLALKYLRGS